MSAVALFAGMAGVGAGYAGDNPALLIVGFWVVLLGVFLCVGRDVRANHAATGVPIRPESAAPYWATLDDLCAWPTAAPGSYPREEA